jgi:hypothetical protein
MPQSGPSRHTSIVCLPQLITPACTGLIKVLLSVKLGIYRECEGPKHGLDSIYIGHKLCARRLKKRGFPPRARHVNMLGPLAVYGIGPGQ